VLVYLGRWEFKSPSGHHSDIAENLWFAPILLVILYSRASGDSVEVGEDLQPYLQRGYAPLEIVIKCVDDKIQKFF
jgi:hypothetical protein